MRFLENLGVSFADIRYDTTKLTFKRHVMYKGEKLTFAEWHPADNPEALQDWAALNGTEDLQLVICTAIVKSIIEFEKGR